MSHIEKILQKALNDNSSDVFVTVGKLPAYRITGRVLPDETDSVFTQEEMDEFIQLALTPAQLEEFKERQTVDASLNCGNGVRFRLNFFVTTNGQAVSMRPLKNGDELTIEALNLPPVVQSLGDNHNGIILIVGATGHGKSSTMGTIINYINQSYCKHIISVEDPVEYTYSDQKSLMSQREISDGDFGGAMRSLVRENPDVIVIGEIRDEVTLKAALAAANSGHLVISTLHALDTVQAIQRLIQMCNKDEHEKIAKDLSLTFRGILAQRLLPSADGQTRYPALEILLSNPTTAKMISELNYNGLYDTIRRSEALGMVSFNRYFYKLIQEGKVHAATALKNSDNPDELQLFLKGMNNATSAQKSSYYCASGENWTEDAVDMRRLLRTAVKHGASDLLVTVGAPPTLRIHGELRGLDLPVLTPPDTQKLLFSLLSPAQRAAFEETKEVDSAISMSLDKNGKGQEQRFRLNGFYQRNCVGIVCRTISNYLPSPQELGLPPILLELSRKKQGLFLVTGPTGSGKTTTLACLINQINENIGGHIITIEDPIEYLHENKQAVLNQRELHNDTLSFSGALRAALREDPDVILVGEMRDTETIASAITAAETGHLVFATVHTNSAPQTIDRLIDSFPAGQQNQIRQQLASVLLAVVSQRLLRKKDAPGRVAAFEIMVGTPPIQALIREAKNQMLPSMLETGRKDGMITMRHSLEELVEKDLVYKEDADNLLLEASQGKPQNAL